MECILVSIRCDRNVFFCIVSLLNFPMRSVRGFSLVELMTVIAFISIMMAITFVSFSGKRDETALKTSAREVAAVVRTAQNNALAGVKERGNDSGLCWHIARATSASSYEIFVRHLKSNKPDGDCSQFPSDTTESSLNTYLLSGGVTFVSSSWGVSFGVPRGDMLESTDQNIVLQKNGKYSAVCVLTSGVVVEKPVSSTVPSCP